MITDLLVQLQPDTYCKESVMRLYQGIGIINTHFSENGHSSCYELIERVKPKIIVVHDDPDFKGLTEIINHHSPHSINVINCSAYADFGIHIPREAYPRLNELGFIVFSFGYSFNDFKEILMEYNKKFDEMQRVKAEITPFEYLRLSMAGEFRAAYRFNGVE